MISSHPPAQRHSITSLEAAKLIKRQTNNLRAVVLKRILQCGQQGATDEELQMALNMNASTQRPRRIELVQAGLVIKSTFKRPTASGRLAAVWQADPLLLADYVDSMAATIADPA